MKKMRDEDIRKGAVEQESPEQPTNTSLSGQLPHRTTDPLVKSSDSDFPEPGGNPEHSGEPQANTEVNPEGLTQNQDPGHRQKRNQNDREDDPLAA
jgi:hypothetical protein